MRWIDEISGLERERRRLGERLRFGATLPDQVFARAPQKFMLLEFDPVLDDKFLKAAQGISGRLGETHLVWGVLLPDPVDYFSKHFAKVPWLRIEPGDSADQVTQSLLADPGNSPADAPAIRADRVVLYGESLRWLIFADRGMELAVLGCFDETTSEAWEALLDRYLYTVEETVRKLVPAIYPVDTAARVARDLRANYG